MNSPLLSPRSRRAAFTLMELLVSISIIALLASLVLGSFPRFIESSRLSSCTANLKLLYSLTQQYTQDNNNALPAAMSTQSWMISLGRQENPQYTTTDPVQNRKYRCPEAPYTYPPAKTLRTYAMNAEGIPAAQPRLSITIRIGSGDTSSPPMPAAPRQGTALLIAIILPAFLTHSHAAEPRTLRVDARGGTDYRTLAEAARAARPGDTIAVAPGSGPYREELYIPQSGTPEAPIIFDGGGETITGFEPLVFTDQNGTTSCDLKPLVDRFRAVQQFHREAAGWVNDNVVPGATIPPLPTVLVYRGERLRQDAATGQLTRYATLSPDGSRLTLLPGTSPEGWELASRFFVVRISDTSHQIYRNLKASGSLNDGINAHGTGEGLVFEHIEAFQNLDEGFSSHDRIVSEIRGGRFWENDNGLVNATSSSTRISGVDIYSNLGIGFGLLGDATAHLEHVRIWDNGISQFSLESRSRVECHDVTIYPPAWTTRQWISTQETRLRPAPATLALNPGSVISGEQPVVANETSPTR